MVSMTYDWSPVSIDNVTGGGGAVSYASLASNASGTHYLASWSRFVGDPVTLGRLVEADGTLATDVLTLRGPTGISHFGASLAGLSDGRFVAAYVDTAGPGNDIRGRLINPDGSPGVGFDVALGPEHDNYVDAAALADGGFVVTWMRSVVGDNDIYMSVHNADGSVRHAVDAIATGPRITGYPSVTGLAGGGFVVAWDDYDGAESEVRFRSFAADGTALDGTDAAGVMVDGTGTVNGQVEVAALADGGFVFAYTEDSWGNGNDITARIYDANGSPRSGPLHVNSAANGGAQTGNQSAPTLAAMPNGTFAAAFRNGNTQFVQAYDAAGNALGGNTRIATGVINNELAALQGGTIVNLKHSVTNTIEAARTTLSRIFTGDTSGETIVGTSDGLREVLRGLGGDDILEGRAGPDGLEGGSGRDDASYSLAPAGVVASLADPALNTGDAAGDRYQSIEGLIGSQFDDVLMDGGANGFLQGRDGNDMMHGRGGYNHLFGGAGNDTAVFDGGFASYVVSDLGFVVIADGAASDTELYDVEQLQFADATLSVDRDGNALFDTLFYLNRNIDVFQAGVNPFDHFNASGRYEGRDPNMLFDTSGYLAIHQDVTAAGLNPLDHYHQTGWREGHDPSNAFDTTLYLLRNPDVAAAGVDPLEHYLAFGRFEGRAKYAAVGQNIVGDFDAEHYLFRYADVAASGVDPLTHYNSFGRHEGRWANAWFDTEGYLAHYADVAASGVNPLEHYRNFGWKEGRDPSALFDTSGYLAANPDVAAAQVDPLQHFLTHGIYEGREPVFNTDWS